MKQIILIAILASLSLTTNADLITRCNFSVHIKEGHGSRIREQNPAGCAILSGNKNSFYSKTQPMDCPPGSLQYGQIQGGVIDTYILEKKNVYSIGDFVIFSTGKDEAIVSHESRRVCVSLNNIPEKELEILRESSKPRISKAEELLNEE